MTPITKSSLSSPIFSPAAYDPQAAVKAEFGRLIHAALINLRFRETLLSDPLCSIEAGYCGESFHFPRELKDQIQLIHVGTLEEFSAQLLQIINTPNHSELAVFHYR